MDRIKRRARHFYRGLNAIGIGVIGLALLASCSPAKTTHLPLTPGALPSAAARAEITPQSLVDIRDIVGVELGTQVVIPECRKDKLDGFIGYARHGMKFPCFKASKGLQSTVKSLDDVPADMKRGASINVLLGPSAVPAGVADDIDVLMLNGAPEKITLSTHGASDQQAIFNLLTSKYGKPTESSVASLQNALGAQYEAIEAAWRMPRMTVLFRGMVTKPTQGIIIATTQAAIDWEASRAAPSAPSF